MHEKSVLAKVDRSIAPPQGRFVSRLFPARLLSIVPRSRRALAPRPGCSGRYRADTRKRSAAGKLPCPARRICGRRPPEGKNRHGRRGLVEKGIGKLEGMAAPLCGASAWFVAQVCWPGLPRVCVKQFRAFQPVDRKSHPQRHPRKSGDPGYAPAASLRPRRSTSTGDANDLPNEISLYWVSSLCFNLPNNFQFCWVTP